MQEADAVRSRAKPAFLLLISDGAVAGPLPSLPPPSCFVLLADG